MSARTVCALVVGALLVGASSGCAADSGQAGIPGVPTPSRVALAPGPTANPAPTTLATPPPAGTVARRSGPFDDRYELRDPALTAGVASARLVVTSDVSALITVELAADFYDEVGRLLGSASAIYSEDEGGESTPKVPHAELDGVPLTVAADPAWRAKVASVVLSVPSLVNE